jgi:hypothetical protein
MQVSLGETGCYPAAEQNKIKQRKYTVATKGDQCFKQEEMAVMLLMMRCVVPQNMETRVTANPTASEMHAFSQCTLQCIQRTALQ